LNEGGDVVRGDTLFWTDGVATRNFECAAEHL